MFVSEGVRVQVAQTTRVDAALQIGTTAESRQRHGRSAPAEDRQRRAGHQRQRRADQHASLELRRRRRQRGRHPQLARVRHPGARRVRHNERASVNGAPGGAFKIYLEGQDITSSNDTVWTSTVAAASVETIGEFSMQTANFAAEYGQVLGGLSTSRPNPGRTICAAALRQPDQRGAGRPSAVYRRTTAQPQAQFRVQRRRSGVHSAVCTPAATGRSSSRTWKCFATGRTRRAFAPRCRPRPIATATSAPR